MNPVGKCLIECSLGLGVRFLEIQGKLMDGLGVEYFDHIHRVW
jgi:hypothetical protein